MRILDKIKKINIFKKDRSRDTSVKNSTRKERQDWYGDARKRSDYYYSIHTSKVNEIDIDNISKEKFKSRKLTSVEINFLKYIDGRDVDNLSIAGYWTHEYNINYKDVVEQYLGQELLEVCNQKSLSSLNVVTLKEILSSKELVKTGKKADLVKRIEDNFADCELDPYLKDGKKYFRLTSKGRELTKDIKNSITKDLELENKCYNLIMAGMLNEAYKEIATFEAKKPLSRGLGIDWELEAQKGLSKSQIDIYNKILNRRLETPREFVDYQMSLKVCTILGNMFGVASDKVVALFKRINGESFDTKLLHSLIHDLNTDYRLATIVNSYKKLGVEEYQFLATLDLSTCEKCAELDGRIFKIDEAVKGVNLPPICEGCRCTAVPHYEGNIKLRRARDPETGKGIYVPGNMTYKEWYKKYVQNNHT